MACRFVIPYAGLMEYRHEPSYGKVVGITFRLGYAESDDLKGISKMVIDLSDKDHVRLVGKTDKIRRFTNAGRANTVYRQRFVFDSLAFLVKMIRDNGYTVVIPRNFNLEVDSVVGIRNELPRFHEEAKKHGVSMDTWLLCCSMCQLSDFMNDNGVDVTIVPNVERVLDGSLGFMDKSPFLCVDGDTVWISSKVTRDSRKYTVDKPGYKAGV